MWEKQTRGPAATQEQENQTFDPTTRTDRQPDTDTETERKRKRFVVPDTQYSDSSLSDKSMSGKFSVAQFDSIQGVHIEETKSRRGNLSIQDITAPMPEDTDTQIANENPMHRWKNKQKFSRSLPSLPIQRSGRWHRLSSVGCEPVSKDIFDNFFGAEQDIIIEETTKSRCKDDTDAVTQCIKLSHPNSKSFSWGEHSNNITSLANEDGRLSELLLKLRSFSKE